MALQGTILWRAVTDICRAVGEKFIYLLCMNKIRSFRVEVLTLCFEFQSPVHVSARPKKNSRDKFETYLEHRRERSKHTSRTVEEGRNIPRARSKHTSSTVENTD